MELFPCTSRPAYASERYGSPLILAVLTSGPSHLTKKMLILALALATAMVFPVSGGANQQAKAPNLIVVQAPIVHAGSLLNRFPKGSQLASVTSTDRTHRVLTPGFFAAADPEVSFDGVRVLFSGRQAMNSPWQIWEMNIDGSAPRQITHCPADCLKAAYLPRGEIVFTFISGERLEPKARAARQPQPDSHTFTSQGSQIWVSKLDGSDAHPITFGPGDFEMETVLKNGMVLVTANSPLLASPSPADRELYTVRSDGTGLGILRCDHQHPAIRSEAKELDDGAVVFVKAPTGGGNAGSELAWIQRGALHNSPLTTPSLHVSSPEPLSGDELVVSRGVGGAAQSRLALYTFSPAAGKFGAAIYQDAKLSAAEAVPVASHVPPRWYWSTLSTEIHRGYFICLDDYMAEGFPRGRIPVKLVRLRVLALDSATHRESLLGEAPIEADGSFYIAVPPDAPVRFEVLDPAGHVVREQRSWIWTRSGEEHGCVGCHEDRAIAPENRWPMALRSFDTPTRLDVAHAQDSGGAR